MRLIEVNWKQEPRLLKQVRPQLLKVAFTLPALDEIILLAKDGGHAPASEHVDVGALLLAPLIQGLRIVRDD